VRQKRIILSLALVSLALVCGTGCGGINVSHSISPLDFFLPGLGSFVEAKPSHATPPVTAVSKNQGRSQDQKGPVTELAKAN
jgi:hypothetical protein